MKKLFFVLVSVFVITILHAQTGRAGSGSGSITKEYLATLPSYDQCIKNITDQFPDATPLRYNSSNPTDGSSERRIIAQYSYTDGTCLYTVNLCIHTFLGIGFGSYYYELPPTLVACLNN
jgi:hypothetical protein